jgi:predicted ArsR family transcriptional regulator
MVDMEEVSEASVPLDRDIFMRTVLRELTGSLQDIVGMAEASGYISVVGTALGEQIDGEYRRALAVEKLSQAQVRDVLVDLKRRINGAFYVIEEREDRIVLGNHACPFGDAVKGRPSLCMMTANVFGHITAQNLGYARVAIEQAIARGDAGCRVVVYLKPDGDAGAAGHDEFFRRGDG